MPKKKSETHSKAKSLKRFESALRRALTTPPEAPKLKPKRKAKRARVS